MCRQKSGGYSLRATGFPEATRDSACQTTLTFTPPPKLPHPCFCGNFGRFLAPRDQVAPDHVLVFGSFASSLSQSPEPAEPDGSWRNVDLSAPVSKTAEALKAKSARVRQALHRNFPVHQRSERTYGSPRLRQHLRQQGRCVGWSRVARPLSSPRRNTLLLRSPPPAGQGGLAVPHSWPYPARMRPVIPPGSPSTLGRLAFGLATSRPTDTSPGK